ncbi:flagellar hook-length control protein FliK [Caulobacter sp. 1776]|uniref:flagellar hook-length control protein FliK n=1 Tax=Caulobacter sp. 1776 TaxID=3156420 RepID=UPI0033909B6E
MAIDPTTPLTPILPSLPAGTAPDSVAVLQALARQAQANATAQLSEIVGRPTAQAPKTGAPVEQVSQTSTQDAAHTTDASGTKTGPVIQQALAAKAPSETRMARVVRAAAAEAVPRQAGLAPLMANVRAVVDRPDMPIEVREAGRALLARTPQAAEIITSQGLRRAVEHSGVFLEARIARAAAAPSSESAPAAIPSNDMKAALLMFRGALSAWLARAAPPIAGDRSSPEAALDAASTPTSEAEFGPAPKPTGSIPATSTPILQTTARPTPAPPTPPNTAPVAEDAAVGTAPVSSPIQMESAGDTPSIAKPPAPERGPTGPSPEDDAIAARFGSFVAAPKTASPPAASIGRAAVSALVQLGLLAEEAAHEDDAAALLAEPKAPVARGYGPASAEAGRPKVPPPPYAGGPMAGQKPTPPMLLGELPTADMVRGLLKGASAALARQDLMQIASLPEPHGHEAETAEAKPQTARLNLDLPFMTPQGVAVAQFEISHDGGGSGGGAVGSAERTYKARFSIDVEPLGPVHALVTLTGARARVSLWAERAETIARFRAGEESLAAALRQAELSPEVAVHSGAPPTQGGVNPLGHFVDQAS